MYILIELSFKPKWYIFVIIINDCIDFDITLFYCYCYEKYAAKMWTMDIIIRIMFLNGFMFGDE